MDNALKIILEGLLVIAEESKEQKRLLESSDVSPDEYFDFEVLDFLPSQVECGVIPADVANEIEKLYKEGESKLKGFNWLQEDDFFKSNAAIVKEWRQCARSLLTKIEAHNKTLVWDGFAALHRPSA
jgi:hypothetical protein